MRDGFLGLPIGIAVAAAVGIIIVRGQAYYWIGRRIGPAIYASRLGRRVGRDRLARVEAMVARRGVVAVIGAHWVAGFRHAIPICAGVTRMPFGWYTVGSVIGSALWTPPWIVGGYAVAWGWLRVFGGSPLALAALIAAVIAAVAVLLVVRRRRRAPDQDTATDPADVSTS